MNSCSNPGAVFADIHIRLIMYKRIASANSIEELEDLQVEMIDRFGLLPKSLALLFQQTQLEAEGSNFRHQKNRRQC